MTSTVEIDKAGRIVVPKKLRDSLRVRAGDRFVIQEKDDGWFIKPTHDEVRLTKIDGLLVMTGGPRATYDVVEVVDQDREQRMQYISGESDES